MCEHRFDFSEINQTGNHRNNHSLNYNNNNNNK